MIKNLIANNAQQLLLEILKLLNLWELKVIYILSVEMLKSTIRVDGTTNLKVGEKAKIYLILINYMYLIRKQN